MYSAEFFSASLWWICPILMIAFCFFMMMGRRGSMMCGFGSHHKENQQTSSSDSAIDILDKRYASGEINNEEYEKKKRTIVKSTGFLNG